MRRAAAPLALALACTALACASAAQRRAPVSAIDAAGVALPQRVGPYVVSLVSYGGDPRQGAFVRYTHDDSLASLPRIDVVVYPADEPLTTEIRLSHDDLLTADRGSRQIDETTLLREEFAPRDDTYRAVYYIELRDAPHRQLVWIRPVGGSYVKARASIPIVPGYDPVAIIEAAVADLFAAAE